MSSETTMRQSTRERGVATLAQLYRLGRATGYRLLTPFDRLFLRLNQLGQYPPIYLRRHAGCLGGFAGSGYEFVAYLKLLLGLQPAHRLWDVGCGYGLLALSLERTGWRGPLIGVDIHGPSIAWAQRTIGRRVPGFRFLHADIHNPTYWPQGRQSARDWLAGFAEGDFDCTVAKSLFTHMLPAELDVYLPQISARLRPAGKAIFTFFLLNAAQADLGQRNKIAFVRPAAPAGYAVKNPAAPTAAVAYDEPFVCDRLIAHGFTVEQIHYGWWSGREDGLSMQDLIVASRR